MIIDGGRWAWYMAGGGIIDGAMVNGYKDFFDLDSASVPPTGSTTAPGLKGCVVNQSWYGITFPLSMLMPTIIVGDELANLYKYDICNKPFFMSPNAKITQTLPEAVEQLTEITGTDKFIVFDGSFGFINCTESAAEAMVKLAPKIQDKVYNELYPKYIKQRGIEIK